MTLREIRRQENDELRNGRMTHILGCAFVLFSDNGIECVTMNDIADSAEIGVASLYRYFKTKEELAVRCAEQAWHGQEMRFSAVFGSDCYKSKTGIDELSELLGMFCSLYADSKPFCRFIYYFDSFIHRSGMKAADLEPYEEQVRRTKEIVTAAIRKGLSDGSMKDGYDADVLYFTLMHSMFSLAQKLSLANGMLDMDNDVPPEVQLKTLASMLADALRK